MQPLYVVTVITAVPSDTAVIFPPLTVATPASLELHITVLLEAVAGSTVAVTVSVSPSVRVMDFLFNVTEVGLIILGFSDTLTLTVVVSPLTVLAVITAEPFPTAVIFPPLTVATVLSLVVHETVLFVASLGATVAVIVSELPSKSEIEVLFNVMLVGLITLIFSSPINSALPPSVK